MRTGEVNVTMTQMPPVVTATDLAPLVDAPATTILDVRTPAEFESSHIAGSYNIPLDRLAEHAVDLAATVGGPVVLVCRSGNRAKQAELTLRQVDLPRLHVLADGLAGWEAAGLPLNRGRARWGMERQVRGVAGGLVLGGALGGLLLTRAVGLLAVGVGGGLLFSALTDSCAMGQLLGKLPYNRSADHDIGAVLAAISRAQPPHQPSVAASAAD